MYVNTISKATGDVGKSSEKASNFCISRAKAASAIVVATADPSFTYNIHESNLTHTIYPYHILFTRQIAFRGQRNTESNLGKLIILRHTSVIKGMSAMVRKFAANS